MDKFISCPACDNCGLLFSCSMMHFNPSTSLLKIVIEMIYIDVQMCIHSMQGFSLFKVVLLCDVTSNTMLFLLKSKGTAIYYIFFQNQKKKRVTGSGWSQEFIQKATFLKQAAPKFLFLRSELILCNIFSPFLFLVYRLSLVHVGRYGADAFKLIFFFFKGASPQQCLPHSVISVHTPCCGAAGQRTCLIVGKIKRTIHSSSDCPHAEKANTWTIGACLSPLLLCGSKTSELVYEI